MNKFSADQTNWRFGLIICMAGLLCLLSACGGGEADENDSAPPTSGGVQSDFTVSGSVGDGPIVGATISVTDDSGELLGTTTSDAQANYNIDLPISSDFPLTITVTGGTDIVTDAPPVFEMQSMVLDDTTRTANINPFTTLIVRTARGMQGGASAANLSTAQADIIDALGFGLDRRLVSDIFTISVSTDNVANIIKSSEALAETIRRIRTSMQAVGSDISEDDVIDLLSSDMTDSVLDGNGPAADARISAMAWVASGQVLVEILNGEFLVEGSDVTQDLNDAISSTVPGATETIADVLITEGMLAQASSSVRAAQSGNPDFDYSPLLAALDSISADSLPELVSDTLPGESSSALAVAMSQVTDATQGELEEMFTAALESASNGDGSSDLVNITNTNPAEYLWGTLELGSTVYVDRNFTYDQIPGGYIGFRKLATKNGDKDLAGDSVVSFDIDRPATVYVGHDVRINPKPVWLNDWIDTGDELSTTDTDLRLYSKEFPIGTVTLGGNEGMGLSMYVVVVESQVDNDPSSPPTVSLEAASSSIPNNGATTLSWSSTNADSCTASGAWSGSKSVSGDQSTGALTVDSTFNLTCEGPGGSASDSVTVAIQQALGMATLSWVPPTTNADDTALDDLAGYKVYYGTSSGDYPNVITLNNPGITTYIVDGLQAGTYYFAVTAFDESENENESAFSNEVSKVIN